MLNVSAVTALLLARQHFTFKASPAEYEQLFRFMSPVPTVYWSCPGVPPSIPFRTEFDDAAENQSRRARREIVKGRFQKGSVGYVYADELELFAALYRKPPQACSLLEQQLLDLLTREGPMNIGLIKEITGLKTKAITPALHKLQEKFLVFEDQADSEWDRSWFLLETEFPGLDLESCSRQEALERLLIRFIHLNGFATLAMARDFYRLPTKDLLAAFSALVQSGAVKEAQLSGADGFHLIGDTALLSAPVPRLPSCVFALHRNDFLVRSNETMLKETFQPEPVREKQLDVLYYLLIDGVFHGVILGKFKNGPFQMEDVWLDLPPREAQRRKGEILAAAGQVQNPLYSPLKRYCGQLLS